MATTTIKAYNFKAHKKITVPNAVIKTKKTKHGVVTYAIGTHPVYGKTSLILANRRK